MSPPAKSRAPAPQFVTIDSLRVFDQRDDEILVGKTNGMPPRIWLSVPQLSRCEIWNVGSIGSVEMPLQLALSACPQWLRPNDMEIPNAS